MITDHYSPIVSLRSNGPRSFQELAQHIKEYRAAAEDADDRGDEYYAREARNRAEFLEAGADALILLCVIVEQGSPWQDMVFSTECRYCGVSKKPHRADCEWALAVEFLDKQERR